MATTVSPQIITENASCRYLADDLYDDIKEKYIDIDEYIIHTLLKNGTNTNTIYLTSKGNWIHGVISLKKKISVRKINLTKNQEFSKFHLKCLKMQTNFSPDFNTLYKELQDYIAFVDNVAKCYTDCNN